MRRAIFSPDTVRHGSEMAVRHASETLSAITPKWLSGLLRNAHPQWLTLDPLWLLMKGHWLGDPLSWMAAASQWILRSSSWLWRLHYRQC